MKRFLLAGAVALTLWGAGEQSNRRAPGFALPGSDGQIVDLADFRGKVVLLEMMRTDCPHCQKIAPLMEQLGKKYAGRVQVLSIVNPPDNPQTVKDYRAKNKVTTPMLFDCGQAAYSFLRSGQVAIPHVFLIDANGWIRNDFSYDKHPDFFTPAKLSQLIDSALAPAPPAKK
jgi:thiol-disulfide isomerase/thioredoxin